jgi:ATP phosphoribosyltransferase
MRVATKYVNLTRAWFASHGVADYRIVESLGATEGAPASGSAELIVDITTTGATLAANALKVVDDGIMLRSEANLVASVTAPWGARARTAVASILARIAAEEQARTSREVRALWPGATAADIATAEARFSARGLWTGTDRGERIVLECPRNTVFALAEWLVGQGATRVSVAEADYVFTASNPLIERLERRIG